MSSLGEFDLMLETLGGIASRLSPGMLSWMDADTDFDPIRNDPRFKALIEKVRARLASTNTVGASL
jgi:hypothetical protein